MCKPASVFACFSEPASNPPQFLRVFGVAASPSRAPFVVFPSHFARPPQTRHLAFQAEPLKAQISNESSYTTTCKHCLRSREDNSVTNYDKTDLQSALPWSPSIALGPGHCQGRKPQATWGAAPTTWGAAPRQPWGAAPGSPPSSYVYVLFFFPYKKGAPCAPQARGGLLFIREEEENINI